MGKRNNWVSASDVGRAAYCPHYLELKHKGANPSKEAIISRARGEVSHEQLNKDAHDRRCYIATYLYGIEDPRTNLLRNFRDSSLNTYAVGRWLVVFYYAASPKLVTLSKRFPTIGISLRYAVDFIVKQIHRRNFND